MNTSIFIKTWSGDIPWLKYCLASIHKYASGFKDIIVVTDTTSVQAVATLLNGEIMLIVEDWPNGYIQQQWIKLNADQYTTSELILYVDSDCVFYAPFTPATFMKYDKPILISADYNSPKIDKAIVWKSITSNFIGYPVKREYMRRIPCMYRSSSLNKFRDTYPHTEYHLKNLVTQEFSEFNALGAYIDKYEPHLYFMVDQDVWTPEPVCEQFWSWGGITEETRTKIEGYLANEIK